MDIVLREKPAKDDAAEAFLTPILTERKKTNSERSISSVQDVVEALESEPALEDFTRCLEWLVHQSTSENGFSIDIPSPSSARIVNLLATGAISTFWGQIRSSSQFKDVRKHYLRCLRSVPGIGALTLRLQFLSQGQETKNGDLGHLKAPNNEPTSLTETRQVLAAVVSGSGTIEKLLDDYMTQIHAASNQTSFWRQAVSLIGGSSILNRVAAVDQMLREQGIESAEDSLGSGKRYCAWLGANVRQALRSCEIDHEQRLAAIVDLFRKALSLGYNSILVEHVFCTSLQGSKGGAEEELLLLKSLKPHEQRKIIYSILELASAAAYLGSRKNHVGGLSALMHYWEENGIRSSLFLSDWITGPDRGRTVANIQVHRAAIAALSLSIETSVEICRTLVSNFGDRLYIRNSPILQQEMQLRDILLSIGLIRGKDAAFLPQLAKSSAYINAISNRIASSSMRPQVLGMILATAVSELVDDAKSRVKFRDMLVEEDLGAFTDLLKVADSIGTLDDLSPRRGAMNQHEAGFQVGGGDELGTTPTKPGTMAQKVMIQAIDSNSESEDESDPSLIQRDKLVPPVYIRDLLRGLSDYDNLDRFQLNLSSAANLIRRKTSFGTEVQEHIEELATALIGAKDALHEKSFADAQLDALIALIVAQPEKMGPWFATTAFQGDYSIAQRLAILSALALSALELAGQKSDRERLSPRVLAASDEKIPPTLPPWLKSFTGPEQVLIAPVETVSSELSRSIIRPIAASAADKVTGPNVLKLQTFTSRLDRKAKGKRIIRNDFSKIAATSFFFPLINRFQLEVETRGSVSAYLMPLLLSHFLKTLALLVSAAGPHALSLPALTTASLDLCIAPRLRSAALEHLPVLGGLLTCLLTVLDVNSAADRNFVLQHGSELLEIKSWMELIYRNIDFGDSERDQVQAVAAGVLVKCSELINKYQEDVMSKLAEFA